MKRHIKYIITSLASAESGQALVLVLVFLALGSLTLVPTLAHISTSLKTGQIYEEKTNELYCADAGIEDGLWRIKYDFMGVNYDAYDFDTEWPYETEDLNDMGANFTIRNVWFPSDVTLDSLGLTSDDAKQIIESEKLVVAGTSGVIPGKPYHVKIDFTPDDGDNLTVKSLGVWLPQGFEYDSGNCSLLDNPSADYYPDFITEDDDAPGGTTVVWGYNDDPYPLFADFPDVVPENTPITLEFTFGYTPPAEHPNALPLAISWITTGMAAGCPNVDDVPISWDIDSRFYKIFSNSGDTNVEAYSSKSELRQMGDAMSGDYVAIGNSLLSDDDYDHYRETWHTPGSFDLDSIPADADAVAAYLYWAGWRDDSNKVELFNDSCANFTNWNDVGQTRVPTGDGDTSGSGDWQSSPCWSKVDETSPDTSDYITGYPNSGAYQLFTFSPFSVDPGADILGLTVYIQARSDDWGTAVIHPSLKVNGTYYHTTAPANYPSRWSWNTYSYTYTVNPDTGSAWTIDDINGTGSNPLQQFGVYSNDLSPNVRVSMVYAEVNFSCWSLSADRFHGTGSGSATTGQRTLTLENPLDLHSYMPTTVVVYWEQSTSNNLESNDALYFAFSRDNGSTWSDDIEAFHDDHPDSNFWYAIPEEHLTSNFKMRFYVNFDDNAEYVNIDNIKVIYMPPDTEVTFKIDNEQVYFDGSTPSSGPEPLVAGRYYTMFNDLSGNPEGYSYACVRDVTALVKKYPENPGEEHHTGNALYTVGDVSADTGSHISFAGWSLIVVYASPQTAGHYIYIRDDNFAYQSNEPGTLDFDMDGQPGGVITNFVVPNPIMDKYGTIIETVAAKLTCFIVEGDAWLPNDYIKVTGEQSGTSAFLYNDNSPDTNVWNGLSYPGTFNEGVDVDTFEIEWADGILTPKDKKLYVDMYSNGDAWNLVYFIISIRSETVTSGTTHYVIHG